MQNKNLAKIGAATVVAAGLAAGVLAAPANADIAPKGSDATVVGSDTVQYAADFLADGATTAGGTYLQGYNTGNLNRLFSFDATGDASGRATYQNNSTAAGNATALPGSIVLRQGAKPQARPNGSGAGISALLADTNHLISFVRSSRLPNSGEINSSAATAFGGLHVYKIATDGLQIAVSQSVTTNAPASLSATDLSKIYNGTYTTWGDVPGYSGTAAQKAATIVPYLPQTGSGTRNDFISDIKSKTGVDLNAAGVLGGNVKTGEEHDPSVIANNPNAISPFSTGRDKLIDSGFFANTPAPTPTASSITLLPGAIDGTTTATSPYGLLRTLYIIARDDDVTAAGAFQAGGTQNYAKALFASSTSWFAKSGNASLFTAAGVTQSYQDLGVAS